MVSPEHHREGDRSTRGILLEKGQGLTLLGGPTAALDIYDQVSPLVPHLRTFALPRRPDDDARGVGARHRSAAAPPRLLLASAAPDSPTTAQTFLDAALAFRGEREQGSFIIIRAQALAHAGHLDEGIRLAIEGLQLARNYDSPRHVSRVQRMYDRLAVAWSPSEPAMAELHEALVA